MILMNVRKITIGGLLLSILLVGCGGGNGSSGAGVDEPPDSGEGPAPSPPTAEAQPSQITMVAAAETSLGTVLVNGEGFTLYILTTDLLNTPSCYGDCQQSWPPLLTEGDPEVGDGIDATMLGVATRHDGVYQVSYDGKPLYLHVNDVAPGDTSGHGIGDIWLVLSPSGEPVGQNPSQSGSGTEGEAQEEVSEPGEYD